MLRIFLALWLAIAPAFAWAGSMTLLGVGSSVVAVLPSVTYVGETAATVSNPTATVTSAALGPAGSKLVVVAVSDAFVVINASMTINGVAATKIGELQFGSGADAYIAMFTAVTAGTSGNIVATATSGSWSAPTFSVLAIQNLSSTTAVATNNNSANSVSTLSTTLATSAGGVVIGAMSSAASNVAPNVYSGTETYTTDSSAYYGTGAYVYSMGHASGTAANGSSTITATQSAVNNTVLLAASWR